MSFCQNHRNHHCIHAHDCKDKSHKHSKKAFKQKESIINLKKTRKDGGLAQILQENDDCQFNSLLSGYELGSGELKRQLQQYVRENMEQQNKIGELTKTNAQLTKKYEKTNQQNGHFVAQLEYYREELDRIIKCTDIDLHNQIKRHLKQSAELTVKIRHLTNCLAEAQKQLKQLEEQNQQLKKSGEASRKKLRQAYQHNEKLQQKLKILCQQNDQYKARGQDRGKKLGSIEERYEILVEQTKNLVLDNKKKVKQLERTIQQQKRQIRKLKNASGKDKQVLELELESLKKSQKLVLDKIKYLDHQIRDLEKRNRQLQVKNEQLLSDLQHSKNVIKKQMDIHERTKRVEQVTETVWMAHSDDNHHHHENKGSKDEQKQNINTQTRFNDRHSHENGHSEREIELTKQIRRLQQVIGCMEQRIRIQVKEEYIMMLGASEQLQKILQQKNVFIKRLIRQKGELLARAH